jgi:chromatin remodeling complex protein RSC6
MSGTAGGARKESMATDTIISTTHGEEETMAKAKAKEKGRPPKKVPFGGYQVCFKGCADTLESLFGSPPMPPSAMTKRLWDYVKRHQLATKG